jgi:hypothetical protein
VPNGIYPFGRKGLDTRLRGYDGSMRVVRDFFRHSRESGNPEDFSIAVLGVNRDVDFRLPFLYI